MRFCTLALLLMSIAVSTTTCGAEEVKEGKYTFNYPYGDYSQHAVLKSEWLASWTGTGRF